MDRANKFVGVQLLGQDGMHIVLIRNEETKFVEQAHSGDRPRGCRLRGRPVQTMYVFRVGVNIIL